MDTNDVLDLWTYADRSVACSAEARANLNTSSMPTVCAHSVPPCDSKPFGG